MYEIIDNNGVIHSGSETEMLTAFAAISEDVDFFNTKKAFKDAKEEYRTGWDGDLKLVHVLSVLK